MVYVAWSKDGNTHVVDLSQIAPIGVTDLKVKYIVTKLNKNNKPVYKKDKITPSSAVKISETPIYFEKVN